MNQIINTHASILIFLSFILCFPYQPVQVLSLNFPLFFTYLPFLSKMFLSFSFFRDVSNNFIKISAMSYWSYIAFLSNLED